LLEYQVEWSTITFYNYNVFKHWNVNSTYMKDTIKKIKLFWDSKVEKCSHMYYDLCVRTLQSAWFKFISLVVLTLIINNFAYTVASVQDEIKLHDKFRTSYYKEWVTKVAFWYTQ
jgi:hypothetical protein